MKCSTKHCRNKAAKGRRICYKCKTAKYKEKHPMRYAFSVLRNNAKRRCIEFTLTYEEFQEFCYQYDYLRGKGKKAESYSVDRIDNLKGYTKNNIQMLTLSENSRKGTKVLNAFYNPETKKVEAYVTSHNYLNDNIDDWDKILEDTFSEIDNAHNHSEDCGCSDCELPF